MAPVFPGECPARDTGEPVRATLGLSQGRGVSCHLPPEAAQPSRTDRAEELKGMTPESLQPSAAPGPTGSRTTLPPGPAPELQALVPDPPLPSCSEPVPSPGSTFHYRVPDSQPAVWPPLAPTTAPPSRHLCPAMPLPFLWVDDSPCLGTGLPPSGLPSASLCKAPSLQDTSPHPHPFLPRVIKGSPGRHFSKHGTPQGTEQNPTNTHS